MARHRFLLALLVSACASCAPAGTTYFGFSVGITDAPPPPRVVFVEEPVLVRMAGTGVYVTRDSDSQYDVFRYGPYWYLCYDGYWYRSSSYRGSFVVVDVRRVPREVVSVPERYWKRHPHGGPPGQMKKRGGPGA